MRELCADPGSGAAELIIGRIRQGQQSKRRAIGLPESYCCRQLADLFVQIVPIAQVHLRKKKQTLDTLEIRPDRHRLVEGDEGFVIAPELGKDIATANPGPSMSALIASAMSYAARASS